MIRRATYGIALAVALSTLTGTAVAGEVGPAEVAKAKELFDAGAREYEASRFEAAIQAFEQAYKIAPRDGITFSIAQAHRRQYTKSNDRKHLVRAVTLYKEYIAKVKEGARVADAIRALGEIEPLVASAPAETSEATQPSAPLKTRIVVNIVVPGTLVSIDGGPAKPAPINEEVKPGPHTVTLTAPGYFEEKREISLAEGEIAPANLPQREKPAVLGLDVDSGAEVSIDGRFVGEGPFARPIELASGRHFVAVLKNGHETFTKDLDLERGKKTAFAADLTSTTQRDISYVVLTTAAGFGAVAAVFAGLAIERDQAAASLLDARETRELSPAEVGDYEDARKDRNLYTGIGIGVGAGGAALALLGIGLHVFDKPRPVAAPTLDAPKVTPGGPRPDTEPSDIEAPSASIRFVPGLTGASVVGEF